MRNQSISSIDDPLIKTQRGYFAPIDLVFSSLYRFKQRQPRQFNANCPAHKDISPSHSEDKTPKEAVLLHYFGGCLVNLTTTSLRFSTCNLFLPKQEIKRVLGVAK
jgi:hypothetical protein